MKRTMTTIIAAIIVLANIPPAFLPLAWAGREPVIALEKYFDKELPGWVLSAVDIDGDGNDEIINICNDPGLVSFTIDPLFGGRARQIAVSRDLRITGATPANLSPTPNAEIVLECVDDTSHIFYIYENVLLPPPHVPIDTIVFEKGEDIRYPEGWDGDYDFCGSYDIDGDNFPEMIFNVIAGYDKYPREVFAYHLRDRKRVWTYEFTTPPTVDLIADLDGDLYPEIIVSGNAPQNWAEKGVEADTRCQVSILSINGQLWWNRKFRQDTGVCGAVPLPSQDRRTGALAFQVSDDRGRTDLYVFDTSRKGIVDSLTVRGVARHIIGYRFRNTLTAEIAVSFDDGAIRTFDEKLNLLAENKLGSAIVLQGVYDLNSDGYPEYCVSDYHGRALILDRGLNVVIDYRDSLFYRSLIYFSVAKSEGGVASMLFLSGTDRSGRFLTKRFLIPDIPPWTWWRRSTWLLNRNKNTLVPLALISSLLMWIIVIKRRELKQRCFYKSVLGNNAFGVLHIVKDRIAGANRKAEYYLDFEYDKLKDRCLSVFLDSPGLEDLKSRLGDLTALSEDQSFDVTIHHKGKTQELEVRVVSIRSKGGQPVEYFLVFTHTDISKREWLTLARGIAHDAKNPSGLASTQLSSLSAQLRSNANTSMEDIIGKIERANANIRRSVDRINKFAGVVREVKLDRVETNVNEYLRDYVTVRRLSLPKEMSFELEQGLALPDIPLDPGYFTQALDNLVDNAIDAISPKGVGKITISSGTATVPFAAEFGENLVPSVFISVSDTGTGIEKESLVSIFNFDFSTKRGKGLGMGLYQVKRIVEEHGGKIEVDSYEGEGTTFTIYLPVGK